MFTGFTESERKQSGFEKVFFEIVRNFTNGKITIYHPRTWTTNVDNLLRQLYDNGISEVAILCYSHGQHAAMDFGRKADKYGVKIRLLLTCDAVYRPSWLPRWNWLQPLAIRAVVGTPKIKVPHTVSEVHSVIQRVQKPCGHTLVAEDDKATLIHPPLELTYAHTRIDEAPEWWDLVREQLQKFTRTN